MRHLLCLADLPPGSATPPHRLRVFALLIAVLFPALAAAQSAGPCAASLAAAETLYRGQDFDTASGLVRECLMRPDLDKATTLRALRLSVLIDLQAGNIAEARQAVVRTLELSPAYRSDPIQDPPSYVALVGTVREQLRAEPIPNTAPPEGAVAVAAEVTRSGEKTPPDRPGVSPSDDNSAPESEARPPPSTTPLPPESRRYQNPFRRAGTSEISLMLGVGSYRGEFSTDGSGPLADLFENSGITLELQGAYTLSPTLASVVSYRFFDLPELVRVDAGANGTQAGGVSVHSFALLGRLQLRPRSSDSPYVQLGLAGVLSGGAEGTRFGLGPQASIGLDVVLTPTLVLFAALDGVLLYPGDVLDRTGARGDLLFFTGVGVRYRRTP